MKYLLYIFILIPLLLTGQQKDSIKFNQAQIIELNERINKQMNLISNGNSTMAIGFGMMIVSQLVALNSLNEDLNKAQDQLKLSVGLNILGGGFTIAGAISSIAPKFYRKNKNDKNYFNRLKTEVVGKNNGIKIKDLKNNFFVGDKVEIVFNDNTLKATIKEISKNYIVIIIDGNSKKISPTVIDKISHQK